MTVYAIGDVQGCADAFERLLAAIEFDPEADRLWLVGDLVNRGPDSAAVLRRVMALGDSAITVLGNHDLHLLAAVAGIRPPSPGDTLEQVLAAPDSDKLVDWLRRRPLLHRDAASRRVLVHAGLPPAWTVAAAESAAQEVSTQLRGPRWQAALARMYGNEPRAWAADLDGDSRRRYTINALTRIRYCDTRGALDFEHTGPPGTQPPELVPWFDHPLRPREGLNIVFGHWSSLGILRREDITATDSGCVWGGKLTAIPLQPARDPIIVDCVAQRGV